MKHVSGGIPFLEVYVVVMKGMMTDHGSMETPHRAARIPRGPSKSEAILNHILPLQHLSRSSQHASANA